MSDSTDSDGSVIFVAEQHTVRVQVHQPGDPTVIPETQQFSIPQTQDDTPTSSRNTTPEVVVVGVSCRYTDHHQGRGHP